MSESASPNRRICRYKIVTFGLLVIAATVAHAQVKQLIQVKTFDEQLQPFKNVELSINGKEFITTDGKGITFTELSESDLPIKTITIKSPQFEPGAWNYSKGTLEVVVRKKSYHIVSVEVKDASGNMLPNLSVTFSGRKTITASTSRDGKLELPLALDEKINGPEQFTIKGYSVNSFQSNDVEYTLIVERIKPPAPVPTTTAQSDPEQRPSEASSAQEFDFSNLDSIQSLTVFYSIFKNYDIKNLSPELKERLDSKFNELVGQLQDSTQFDATFFLSRISDSSFVSEDIQNLLNQAAAEDRTLRSQRNEFDEKISIINQKLERGISNLDTEARASLLADLIALEKLLTENESRFYKNINDYRQIINTLKERYFDFQSLENKLSESEARRLEEERIFEQRLIGISMVVLLFAILIILLITFSGRLRRQKDALEKANAEVKRINENLEAIVLDRTKLLADANRELDTFLYRASHDLRSPVCSIIGLCNIALHLSDGESKDLVRRVAYTTEGMDRLLKKLSIISEINQPTGYSSITLVDIVEKVAPSLVKSSNKEIQIELDCPADLVFYSYPNLVEAVVTNLIENAIFYCTIQTVRQPRIALKASVKDDMVELIVSDNGIGIPENIQKRLFGMFFKGSEHSKGNGLGLYIVQKSLQSIDGTITVDSQPGKYTTFTVRLPMNTTPMNLSKKSAIS